MIWVNNSRTLAVFAVVFLHVAAGIVLGTRELNSSTWWIGNVYDSLVRWCVPAFVMISGLLLLDPAKQESLREFYNRRAKRILVPLLFWTAFYSGWTSLKMVLNGEQVSIFFLLEQAVSGQPYYHMWYLYMIMGLYLFVPFIRRVVWYTSYKDLVFLSVLLFFLSAISGVIDRPSLASPLFITWFLPYLPYFLAGHLINITEWDPDKRVLIVTILLSVALTSIGFYFDQGPYFYSYLSVTVIPMSVSVMFLMKTITFTVVHKRIGEVIAALSLGVYLVHPIVLDTLSYFGVSAVNYWPLLSVPAISAIVFMTSLAMSYAIRRTPYLNRVI